MIQWMLIDAALRASEASYRPTWGGITLEERGSGAFARITEDAGFVHVAFRGTDEFRDWLANLRALPPWLYGGAWVHRGFMVAHESIWSRVRTEIERRGGHKPLLITGHSLGGALAELSALFLRDYPAPVSLVCFGKPNVFLKPRAARFEYLRDQISVVAGSDGVARVPAIGFGPDLGQAMLYLATKDEQAYWIPEMNEPHERLIRADWRLSQCDDHHNIAEYRRRINHFLNQSEDRAP